MELPGASRHGLNIVRGEKASTGTQAAGMFLGGEKPSHSNFVPCLHFEVWIWP